MSAQTIRNRYLLYCMVMLAGISRVHGQTLEHEAVIPAPLAEVWQLFTTAEGYLAMGTARAEVDLRVGGEIRTHYDADGVLGDDNTIVNEILAYEPMRMLSLRVKQPPANFPFRDAIAGTWSVMYFSPEGESGTRVRMVGLGYGDDPQSQQMREFFRTANQMILDMLVERFQQVGTRD